jgi:hypothetical protein
LARFMPNLGETWSCDNCGSKWLTQPGKLVLSAWILRSFCVHCMTIIYIYNYNN